MHRDANLRKRNGLVIPGLLLAFYSLVGILYTTFLRGSSDTCGVGRYVELFYGCRDSLILLAIPLVIGIAMLVSGLLAFPNKSTCQLGQGTWPTAILVLLSTVAGLPILLAVVVYSIQDSTLPYTILSGETLYRLDRLLGMLGFAGLLIFVPYLGLYINQVRGHACCRENSCFVPCFCDEPAGGAAETADVAEIAEPVSLAPSLKSPAPSPAPKSTMTPSAALSPWPAPATVPATQQPALTTPRAPPAPAKSAPVKTAASKAPTAGAKTRTVSKTPAKKTEQK